MATTIAPARAEDASETRCVDVGIGQDMFYDCLNQMLKRFVPPGHEPTSMASPYHADIPAPAAGTFNQAATRERLGNAFGRSLLPQRPPPPTYAIPLIGTQTH